MAWPACGHTGERLGQDQAGGLGGGQLEGGLGRVQSYQKLQPHLQMDVYGRSHMPLPREVMTNRLSQYKFYLAFKNSLHPDYITEKLWRNALQAWAVPVVLGPSRRNYEQFLPPEDFQSPKDLTHYLLALVKDHTLYPSCFRWR